MIPTRTFDWQASEPHLLLLSRFLSARGSKDALSPNWEGVLGESPQVSVDRFLANGLLVPASLTAKLDRTFKATDLKPFLKERGLPVSGNKDVLLARLLTVDHDGMAAKVAHLDIVECSPEAREIAKKYVAGKWAEKDAAVAESLVLLCAKDFGKASLAVSGHEAKQVFQRGLNIDWSRHSPANDIRRLETMFSCRPKILDGLSDEEWEPLRIAGGMMLLWGVNSVREWLPKGFVGVPQFDADTAARMVLFHANHSCDMEQYRRMGVKNATVRGCGDASCEACRQIANKPMPLDSVPELPHAACTHKMGCRCYVEPELLLGAA